LLQQPVDERGFAMVDMGDDGDVAKLHRVQASKNGPESARGFYASDIEGV
jgi:hypothetical protein